MAIVSPKSKVSLFSILAAFVASCTIAPASAAPRSYILNGYSFGGLNDLDTQALEKKFKHHKGDRITRASIGEDAAILVKEMKARHIEGHVFTTFAEKKGHVWVIFDVLDRPKMEFFKKVPRHLEAQRFEGATLLSAKDLAQATGLQRGAPLSESKISDAQRAIAAAYAKVVPGKTVRIAGKIQGRPDGGVILSWIIQEPK